MYAQSRELLDHRSGLPGCCAMDDDPATPCLVGEASNDLFVERIHVGL